MPRRGPGERSGRGRGGHEPQPARPRLSSGGLGRTGAAVVEDGAEGRHGAGPPALTHHLTWQQIKSRGGWREGWREGLSRERVGSVKLLPREGEGCRITAATARRRRLAPARGTRGARERHERGRGIGGSGEQTMLLSWMSRERDARILYPYVKRISTSEGEECADQLDVADAKRTEGRYLLRKRGEGGKARGRREDGEREQESNINGNESRRNESGAHASRWTFDGRPVKHGRALLCRHLASLV